MTTEGERQSISVTQPNVYHLAPHRVTGCESISIFLEAVPKAKTELSRQGMTDSHDGGACVCPALLFTRDETLVPADPGVDARSPRQLVRERQSRRGRPDPLRVHRKTVVAADRTLLAGGVLQERRVLIEGREAGCSRQSHRRPVRNLRHETRRH